MELRVNNCKDIIFVFWILLVSFVTQGKAYLSLSRDALPSITDGQLYEYYLSKFTDPKSINSLDFSNNNLVYVDPQETDIQLASADEAYSTVAKSFPMLEQQQIGELPTSLGYLIDSAPPRLENAIAQKLLEQLKLSTDENSDDNDHQLVDINKPYVPQNDLPTESRIANQGNVEYIDHPLALGGRQYVQGGAGEGRQLLGPDGTFENVQVIKSDDAVPSYCDPPNPCPMGYSAEDGCIEKFINSASFSREYQVKQQCSCDNEHSLFNCAAQPTSSTIKTSIFSSDSTISNDINEADLVTKQPNRQQQYQFNDNDSNGILQQKGENKENAGSDFLSTLARAIQNRFGYMTSVRNLITSKEENHKSNSI